MLQQGKQSCVQEQRDEQRGRHLVALKAIPAGNQVVVDHAVAATLYDNEVPHRCHLTFQLCTGPLRCGACKHARYATKQNQRKAWSTGHREECAALARCHPKVPPPTVRLVARIFWLHSRLKKTGQGVSANTTAQDIQALEHHWAILPAAKKQLYAQMAALTRHYMQGGAQHDMEVPDSRDIALMLARCACNNHTICDDELHPTGVGLFPTGALINHSCSPNAMQSFQGQHVTFTALQDIKPGAEITISYIELAATHAERRQQLLEQYYFDIDGASQIQEQEATAFIQAQAGAVTAEAFVDAPCRMDAADHQLTAVQTASGDAHVMVFTTAAPHSDPEASFPHSMNNAETTDEGTSDELVAAGNLEESMSETLPSASSTDEASAPALAQDLVRVQCWGFGIQGIIEQHQLLAVSQQMSDITAKHKQCLQALDMQQPDRAKSLALSGLQLADHMPLPFEALGKLHILRMRLHEGLLRSYISPGTEWAAALSVAQNMVPVYELVYPKVWPNKGLHFAMMAKISALLDSNSQAVEFAGKALKQLQYTLASSPVLEEVRQIMYESSRSC